MFTVVTDLYSRKYSLANIPRRALVGPRSCCPIPCAAVVMPTQENGVVCATNREAKPARGHQTTSACDETSGHLHKPTKLVALTTRVCADSRGK